MKRTTTTTSQPSHLAEASPALPSTRLLSSALVGLVGAGGLSGCSKSADPVECGAPTFNNVVTNSIPSYDDPPAALAGFKTLCATRGGYLQTHAWCAGANSCKGLSWSFGVLTDHSCKGMNTCEGFSCVDSIADKGLQGAAIYTTSCSGCHGTPAGAFKLVVPPGTAAERLAAFQATTPENGVRLLSIVAFGTQGHNTDGTSYSNMPSFRAQYSRQELQRVVDHIRALPLADPPAEYVSW